MELDPHYHAVIKRIESLRDSPARIESFERFLSAYTELKPRLKIPSTGQGIALIAGTNGKGSVGKTLEVLLARRGYQVGLYTSPHMMKTTERIRSFGEDLTEVEFVASFRQVEPFVTRFGLSHFEILTLMMLEVFFGGRIRPVVNRAIIEVGVGGRLDPTAVLPHEVSVITRLGLDHQDILGQTLAQIAAEKLAVVQEGSLVIYAPPVDEIKHVFESERQRRGGTWIEAKPFPFDVMSSDHEPAWMAQTPWGDVRLGLLGERAVANTSIALMALDAWGEPVQELLPFLGEVRWPCRMEGFLIGNRQAYRRVYLSGDHNPQGVQSLAEILSRFRYEKLYLVVGVGKNKEASEMLELFSRLPRVEMILTQTPFRSSPIERYKEWKNTSGVPAVIIKEPEEAIRAVLQKSAAADLVLCSGSLYLAGYLRRFIQSGELGEILGQTS